MSRWVRISPLLLVLYSACSFDPSGLRMEGGNNANGNNANGNNANGNNSNSNNSNSNNSNGNNNNNNNNTGACGDGQLDPGEDCDGSNLGGATCVSLGYAGSGLACSASCEFDVTRCDPVDTCGNGTVDLGEECDGVNLDGETCASLGYYDTGLACDSTCHFDLSVCEANGWCGDGQLDTSHEECDGADVGGQNCSSVGAGVGSLGCSTECHLDLSSCVDPEVCDDFTDNDGDGLLDCLDTDCAADPWCVNGVSTEFGASEERVQIGSLQDVTGTNPVLEFSVSFWLKLNGNQPDWATPLATSSDDHWDDGFGFYHSSGDRIRFWINQWDGGTRATTGTVLANDVWYHIVGTYDAALGADNIKIYLDGALSGTGDCQVAVTQSGRPISIGALYTDDMVGFIDEVAFWPITLNAQNVQAIYNGGSPFNLSYDQGNYTQSSALSAYYRMGDQDTLPTITDRAGGHNGTVVTGDGNEFVTDVP